jgi:hypothetical protein
MNPSRITDSNGVLWRATKHQDIKPIGNLGPKGHNISAQGRAQRRPGLEYRPGNFLALKGQNRTLKGKTVSQSLVRNLIHLLEDAGLIGPQPFLHA